MPLVLKHWARAAFLARVREEYRDAEGARLVRIARFILATVDRGDVSDDEWMAVFNMPQRDWRKLKSQMSEYIAADDEIRFAVGE
jgi:hypothetical protein